MPEARDRLPNRGLGDSPSVFGIRRGYLVGRLGHEIGQQRRVWDNKENIPPESSRSGRRQGRPKQSPLPSWYPRTPLRDITAIVAAMERIRSRRRIASEARRIHEGSDSPRTPFPASGPIQEPGVSEENPLMISLRPSNNPQALTDLTPSKSSPQSLVNPANEASPASLSSPDDSSRISVEKKLSQLQDIEKFVRANVKGLKKASKKQPKKKKPTTTTLRSMR